MITFEEACKHLNIPADRVGLVKRNVELRTKLVEALTTIETMQRSIHEVFKHDGDFAVCDKGTCESGRMVLAVLQPN